MDEATLLSDLDCKMYLEIFPWELPLARKLYKERKIDLTRKTNGEGGKMWEAKKMTHNGELANKLRKAMGGQ